VIELATALVVAVAGCGSVGVGIAWLNDRREAAKRKAMPAADPRRILETRYAKGELDHDEFTRRMHDLTYGPPLELGERRTSD
jgi:uncharacterized membrane protein